MAFVLMERGNCSFEGKAREAQRPGFDAAVVYDNEEKARLYSKLNGIGASKSAIVDTAREIRNLLCSFPGVIISKVNRSANKGIVRSV